MTLPQATRLDITAPMPSPEQQMAYSASRHDKWFKTQRVVVKREEARPVIVMDRTPDRVLHQQDSHVAAWLEWRGNPPLGYLKMRCREIGVSYEAILSRSRKHAIVKPRQALVCDVKRAFPKKSLPEIGRLFGGFDHTTILNSLKKQGLVSKNPRRCAEEEAGAIYNFITEGKTQTEMAAAVGFSQTAVSALIHRHGWKYESPVRRVAKHHDDIKRMFEDGQSFARMSQELGFVPDGISKYVKRQGWTRSQSQPRADNR